MVLGIGSKLKREVFKVFFLDFLMLFFPYFLYTLKKKNFSKLSLYHKLVRLFKNNHLLSFFKLKKTQKHLLFYSLKGGYPYLFMLRNFYFAKIAVDLNDSMYVLPSFKYSFNITLPFFNQFSLSSLFFTFSRLFTRRGFTGFFLKKFNKEPALFLFMFLLQFIEIYRFPILFYPKRFGKMFYQIPKILAKIPSFFAFYFWRKTNLKLDFQDQFLKNFIKIDNYMDLFFANFDRIIRSFRGRSKRFRKKRFRSFDRKLSNFTKKQLLFRK